MTLGQRVAVMRDGTIQQIDTPQRLYREPANIFVAAFIGSPAMNLVNAVLAGDEVLVGEHRIPLPPGRRPRDRADGLVVVGIRPEAFEDAAFADRSLPRLSVKIQVLEDLGSDTHVFFEVDAEPVAVEGAHSDDADEDGTLLTTRERALFAARVDPRTAARIDAALELAVDPERLYFFEPGTGKSLLTAAA